MADILYTGGEKPHLIDSELAAILEKLHQLTYRAEDLNGKLNQDDAEAYKQFDNDIYAVQMEIWALRYQPDMENN